MKVTTSNVAKVISFANAIFLVLLIIVYLIGPDAWQTFIFFTGVCGMTFWIMIAPIAIDSLRIHSRPRGISTFAEALWYALSIPFIILGIAYICMHVYWRLKGW
jgi:hypothetical protein